MRSTLKYASLVFVAFQLTAHCRDLIADDTLNDFREKQLRLDKLRWSEIAPDGERLEVLDFLAAQTKGNYEKINTWKSEYAVATVQQAPEMLANRALTKPGPNAVAKNSPKPPGGARHLLQRFESRVKVVIDLKSGSVFRDTTTAKMSFSDATTGENVRVDDVIPLDERTIVARDRFLYLSTNSVIPRYAVIPDHPDARNKRAAFWDEPGKAKHSSGRLFDPRIFYDEDSIRRVWEFIEFQTNGLRGSTVRDTSQRLSVSKALEDKVVYYRHRFYFGTEAQKLVTSLVYSSQAGFNPVLVEQTFNNKPTRSVAIEWTSQDDIFIPKKATEVIYRDLGVQLVRTVALLDSRINDVIDKDQFELQGLGLKDGDLVLNEVERVVYSVKDGGTVKLADYNEPYNPRPSAFLSSKMVLILLNLGIMIGCIFFIARRLRDARRVTST